MEMLEMLNEKQFGNWIKTNIIEWEWLQKQKQKIALDFQFKNSQWILLISKPFSTCKSKKKKWFYY